MIPSSQDEDVRRWQRRLFSVIAVIDMALGLALVAAGDWVGLGPILWDIDPIELAGILFFAGGAAMLVIVNRAANRTERRN